ncbi:MAG: TRAP transporter permease [Aminobacteriaceae bacterium]|uniref:TRAP transporter permease n=1 Tax=Aminivibrio sp. TaxID=1872489 RepID=UPI002D1FC170|nr:TRAP transporter fused permease subunit [Aminivibrio sp.]
MECFPERKTNLVITAVSAAMGIFHVYTAFFGVLTALWQRSIHLTFGFLICYLTVVGGASLKREKIFPLIAAGASLFCLGHFIVNFQAMILRFGEPDALDLAVGTMLIVLVLDFARRSVGNILPGIAVVFLLYAVAGPYLPGMLWHRGYDVTRIIYQISLSTEGIFGTPLGVSASYVFIFVLFGAFLEITGAGQFYIDFAVKAVGGSAGGPAKAAVVASSLFGSVSGSAVANVAGTGAVTIPLMRSIGYRPEFAAAVEAVASTGGQIMPPLMGAAAFIMAEILAVPYYKVALGALIPALIFYGTVFTMVHCRAKVLGLSGAARDSLPPMKTLLREQGIFFIPLLVLIYFMIIAQYSVMKAAVYSLLATVLVGFFKKRMGWRDILGAFESGARVSLVVIASTACAGIIVAVMNLTGLGMKFSSLVLAAGGNSLLLVLIMIMLASLLLGMGLPTTPAYLILAVLGAPTLVKLGVEPLAAHLFVFYFGCMSMITPPVGLAVYAASCIAEADFWKTSKHALLLALPAFLVPYMFVFHPSLVGLGDMVSVLSAAASGLLGAVILGAGLSGWYFRKVSLPERGVLCAAGILLILPGWLSNAAGILPALAVWVFRKKLKN